MKREELLEEILRLPEEDIGWIRSRIYRIYTDDERKMEEDCMRDAGRLMSIVKEDYGIDIIADRTINACYYRAMVVSILREKYPQRGIGKALHCNANSTWRMWKKWEGVMTVPRAFRYEISCYKSIKEKYGKTE